MKDCYVILVIFVASLTFIPEIEPTSFILKNNCDYTIWPAAMTLGKSPAIGKTGFVLEQGLSLTTDAPSNWNGRFWPRTFCSTNKGGEFICSVGDCGTGKVTCDENSGNSSTTLVEFSLNGFGGSDYYDVSLVDGFNVPVTITPQNGDCESIGCAKDLNSICPGKLVVGDQSETNNVIACKSPCADSDISQAAQSCTSSDFADAMKAQCPQVYVYSTDSSTYSCPNGGDYVITFCPSPTQYVAMLCLP